MSYPRPPQKDIDDALQVEKEVSPENKELYLKCMNGKPMSERREDNELRNGCILTFHVYKSIIDSY